MFRVVLVIFVLASICFSQQTENSKSESLIKAESIINKAKEAAGFSESMTSFQIKLRNFGNNKIQQIELPIDEQLEITVTPANRIRILTVFKSGLNRAIWNEKGFKETVEFDSTDGQRKVVDVTKGVQLSQSTLGAIKSKIPNIKSPDSKAAAFSSNLWEFVFPLILTHPIESSTKFEYVGRAQAGEQTAQVLQTTTAGGRNLQLFFDEKTSHLLLMIEKYKGQGKEFVRKCYYSNREKRNGILIPTKVRMEHKVIKPGEDPLSLFYYLDLIDFETNPTVKPEIFKIS